MFTYFVLVINSMTQKVLNIWILNLALHSWGLIFNFENVSWLLFEFLFFWNDWQKFAWFKVNLEHIWMISRLVIDFISMYDKSDNDVYLLYSIFNVELWYHKQISVTFPQVFEYYLHSKHSNKRLESSWEIKDLY